MESNRSVNCLGIDPSSLDIFPTGLYINAETSKCSTPIINVAYTNIRSIVSKIDEFRNRFFTYKPQIIAVTETWLNHDIADSMVAVDGYYIIRVDRKVRRGGGVALYVDQCIGVDDFECYTDTYGTCELMVASLSHVRNKVTIALCYRSPCSFVLTKEFSDILTKAAMGDRFLCLGDFNISSINMDDPHSGITSSNKLDHDLWNFLLDSLLLVQHVSAPTRIMNDQSSLLDLILSKSLTDVRDIMHEAPIGVSDHCVLLFHFSWISNNIIDEVETKIFKHCWYHADQCKIHQAASTMNFVGASDDVEDCWKVFRSAMCEIIEKYVPTKIVHKNKKVNPPWFNRELKSELRRRNRLFKLSCKDNTYRQEYVNCRNVFEKLKKRKKFNYEMTIAADFHSAPKRFWAHIRRNRTIPPAISSLRINDNFITSPQDVADTFASTFQLVTNNTEINQQSRVSHSRSYFDVTTEEVYSELNSLRHSSPGPDGLHPQILKILSTFIASPLAYLFQLSLAKSILPLDWKIATVVPVHKKGDRHNPENYRAISLQELYVRC